MHVTFLGHAQLLVRAGGRHLLLDPWFAEPVFSRAWWRYPPAPYPDARSLPPIDALLLSHTHPDHSGPGTLAQLDPATPTFALPFPSGGMARRLAGAGYRAVTWLPAWETREILPGVRVTFVPHDGGWEVSSIVVEAGGVRLYHGNDNPLSVAAYREIVARLGPIDVAFLPFAGASSYPTCFDWPDRATLEARAQGKKQEGLQRLLDGVAGLAPRHAVPFASSWALLEESELWRNFFDRPTPPEAARAAGETGLSLEPGDEWTPDGPIARGLSAGWSYDVEGTRRLAAQRRADVIAARAPAAPRRGGADALDRAFRDHAARLFAAAGDSIGKLELLAGFVAEGDEGGRWHMIFRPGEAPRLEAGAHDREDETLILGAAELHDIAAGAATWEDPWYGYRLRVRKRPGAGYYRAFWEMLLNFC
jgi:L-ascorbate metabolism protein UlaG (beta-lactamase superfamily)